MDNFFCLFFRNLFLGREISNVTKKKDGQEIIQQILNNLLPENSIANKKQLPFKISNDFGTVVESWDGSAQGIGGRKPHVILIQDIHENYGAQKNLARILQSLSDQLSSPEKTLLVCSEGAWGRLYPEWLSLFPDQCLRNRIAEDLLKGGKITGEEYFVMLRGMGKLEIHGVEDEEIYKANLIVRSQSLKTKDDFLQQFVWLDGRIKRLKGHLYGKALAVLDQKTNDFEEQKISLEQYLNFLDLIIPKSTRKDLFPHIMIFEGLLLQEQLLHGNTMGSDKKFRFEEKTKDLSVTSLWDYARHLKAISTLQIINLIEEVSELEGMAYQSLAHDDIEKKMLGLDKVLKMNKKLWNEKMIPSEWENYLHYSSIYFPSLQEGYQLSIDGLEKIENILEQAEKRLSLGPFSNETNSAMTHYKNIYVKTKSLNESFYKLAEKRSDVMVQKALDIAKRGGNKFVLLIAGGFHTPGITRHLTKEGVPYTVLCPKLDLSSTENPDPHFQYSTSTQTPSHQPASYGQSLLKNYIKCLKESKDKGSGDYRKDVDTIIDILKNKIHLTGPLVSDGKIYFFGKFKGKMKWSHFAFEFLESPTNNPLPSNLNLFNAHLRNTLGTQMTGDIVPFPLLQIACQSMIGNAQFQRFLDEKAIKGEFLSRRFKIATSLLTTVRTALTDFLDVADIETQGNSLAFSLLPGEKNRPTDNHSSAPEQGQETVRELSQQRSKPAIVVIGAGIAGLVAAYNLKKQGFSVTVLESDSRVGGRMKTANLDGVETDLGAQFLSTSYSTLIPLINELGLGKYLVEVAPWTGFIQNGNVYRIRSDNLLTLLTSGAMKWKEWLLFNWRGLKIIWSIRNFKTGDYSSWHPFDDQDAAVWIEAHFGKWARDYIYEPFFHGLYFQPLEGMSKAFVLAIIALGISKPKTLILKGGMELLTKTLEEKLRSEIKLNSPVKSLRIMDETVSIQTDQQTFEANQVILATPAPVAKGLYVQANDIEQKLMSTGYSSSILISVVIKNMNWRDRSSLKGVYGLLIPRTERTSIASIAIESSKHHEWEGEGEILNVMLSGEKSLEMLDQPDDQILTSILPELTYYFPNLLESSYTTHIRRWKTAMPKSPIGRSKLIEQYRTHKDTRRVILAGDYMGMPYTDSAAETGIWSSSQILSSVLDPILRAIMRVLQRQGWRRASDLLDGFRKVYNIFLGPGLETYLFIYLPAMQGLIPLVAFGFFGFLLFEAATEIIFDPHLRKEQGKRSLVRALWAFVFIAPYLLPFVGFSVVSPDIQFLIVASMHTLHNLTQSLPPFRKPRLSPSNEVGNDIQRIIDRALRKEIPGTSEDRCILALANSIREEWKEKKQVPFILLDLDGLVVANKNGISIDSWVAQCVRRINEHIGANALSTNNVGVVLDPKSMDQWALHIPRQTDPPVHAKLTHPSTAN
jgi:oxygen-dependent protoporphyrinogen oxidase